jgi:hypothetical protein
LLTPSAAQFDAFRACMKKRLQVDGIMKEAMG